MESVGAENSDSAKADLIELLEFEIKRIQEDEKRPGWTVWALGTAVAGIVMLILKEVEANAGRIVPIEAILLFFGFWYAWQFLCGISNALWPWATIKPATSRFWYTNSLLSGSRLAIVAAGLCEGILLSIVLKTPLLHRGLVWWVLVLDLGGGILATVIALFVSYRAVPFSLSLGGAGAFPFGLIAKPLVSGFCAFGLARAIGLHWSQINLPEFRFAISAALGVLIVLHLLEVRVLNPLLNTLTDLRRKLGLAQISEELARRETQLAFNGMHASDVLRRKLDAILTKHRQVAVLQNEIVGACDAFGAVAPGSVPAESGRKALLEALLESVGPKSEKCRKLIAEISADLEKFRKSVDKLTQYFPHAGQEFKQAFAAMKENIEQLAPGLQTRAEEIDKRVSGLKLHAISAERGSKLLRNAGESPENAA